MEIKLFILEIKSIHSSALIHKLSKIQQIVNLKKCFIWSFSNLDIHDNFFVAEKRSSSTVVSATSKPSGSCPMQNNISDSVAPTAVEETAVVQGTFSEKIECTTITSSATVIPKPSFAAVPGALKPANEKVVKEKVIR